MLTNIKSTTLPNSPKEVPDHGHHDTYHESMFSNELEFSSRSSSREKGRKDYDPKRHNMKSRRIFDMEQFRKDKNMSGLIPESGA
jgi:hypothetical protein